MASSSWSMISSPIIPLLLCFLLVSSSVCQVVHASEMANQTFNPEQQLKKLKNMKARLRRINKPALKTFQAWFSPSLNSFVLALFLAMFLLCFTLFLNCAICLLMVQSPDGDLIDCVHSHQQPAFDHPQLKGQRPLVFKPELSPKLLILQAQKVQEDWIYLSTFNLQDPPERPQGLNPTSMIHENFQLWSLSGNICPDGTIPIRRTREQDVLRASSVRRYGRKSPRHVRRDSSSNGHEVSTCYIVMNVQTCSRKKILEVFWEGVTII